MICANEVPDRATIARFRVYHESALGHLFDEVLRLCAAAGFGSLVLVAIESTKIAADVALRRNRTAAAL